MTSMKSVEFLHPPSPLFLSVQMGRNWVRPPRPLTSKLRLPTIFVCRSFASIMFLNFFIVLPFTALLIDFHNAFPSLSPSVYSSILFCVLNSAYGFSHCD